MNHKTPNVAFRLPHLKGFTLVELLIVLTVIGILVGLLLPAINGAMNSSRELAIRTEMVQIEQAIESFRTEYGFYPPSFEQFDRTVAGGLTHPGLSAFLQYLNRVAPNHQERSSTFPSFTGQPRAVVWWNRVGRFLDQQGSLVFWLSGLCKSQQFPLTGGADYPIPAFNVSQYSSPVAGSTSFTIGGSLTLPDGSPFEVERDVRFEFQPGQQLYALAEKSEFVDLSEGNVPFDNNGGFLFDQSELPIEPQNPVAMVAAYIQPYGPSDGDKLYRYRDAASYEPFFAPTAAAFPGYAYIQTLPGQPGDPHSRSIGDPLTANDFVNPKTFQLFTSGMDGESGVPFAPPMSSVAQAQVNSSVFPLSSYSLGLIQGFDSTILARTLNRATDNIANFAEGRLENFWTENE